MTVTLAKWTLNEYLRMIDAGVLEGRRVELLCGEIVEMSPKDPVYADCSTNVVDYLRCVLGDRAKVRDGKPITLPHAS